MNQQNKSAALPYFGVLILPENQFREKISYACGYMNYYNAFISFLQRHMLTCPSRKWLHMDCPGCGMQRSIIALFRGHIYESFLLHPAGILVIAMLLLTIAHLIYRFRKGALLLIWMQSCIAIVSLTFYVYKILNHQIFH